MKDFIDSIILTEWAFFDHVHNAGGRANCQDDFSTFSIMRKSQFLCWSNELLQSYYQDLIHYQANHGNPITLKYAYMMKYTSPEEYLTFVSSLPGISPSVEALVDEITKTQTAWTEEFYEKYPHLKKGARPIHASEDSLYEVSSETYLRCELYTYSEGTLQIYRDYLEKLKGEHKNLAAMILENTFKAYGYSSLEEAENSIS